MKELIPVAFMGAISPNRFEMTELDLEPGHYLAVCFIPDEETEEPHALRGMVTIFSDAAEGEEVEPPASSEPEEHEID